METHVDFGGRLIARLYERDDGRTTVDLSPARQAAGNSHTGYDMPAGLKALDEKYGRGSFKVGTDVPTARETVLAYARMSEEQAARV